MTDITSSPSSRFSNTSSGSSPNRTCDFVEVQGNIHPNLKPDGFHTESPASVVEVHNPKSGSSYIISLGNDIKIPLTPDMEITPMDTDKNTLTFTTSNGFMSIRFENSLVFQRWYKVITHGIVQARALNVLHSKVPTTPGGSLALLSLNPLIDDSDSRDTMVRVLKRLYDRPHKYPTKNSPGEGNKQIPSAFPKEINGMYCESSSATDTTATGSTALSSDESSVVIGAGVDVFTK